MNSLLKTVHSMSNKKNVLIREGLQKQLSICVMEMQSARNVIEGIAVTNCDEAMSLCATLEAVFLHGLKDTLLNRVTEALSGPDFDAMPQPSFWGPLLVFSHRQIIDQIQSLSQITTEVGYCRAWIRLALNEGMLASYLCSIRRDNSALKPYYSRAAFIRDLDLVEVAQRLIESLDYIRFDLACNSSLLNFWSSTPLIIASIWSPPMKSCPIYSAVDIAKTINSEPTDEEALEEIDTVSSIGSLGSFNSSYSALNKIACTSEDEALRIILSSKTNNDLDNEKQYSAQLDNHLSNDVDSKKEGNKLNVDEKKECHVPQEPENNKENVKEDNKDVREKGGGDDVAETSNIENNAALSTIGNSLIGRLGWSSSFEDCDPEMISSMISSQHSTSDPPQTPGEGSTYDALIKNYQPTGCAMSPDINEFLSKYPQTRNISNEIVTPPVTKSVESLDDLLGKIPREKGLDSQNYSCLECGQLIGLTFAKAYLCCFSGDYFCEDCMAVEEFPIPSRMIHNWDLQRYRVSQKAGKYLMNCTTLVDLKILNPRIYNAVDCMTQLQSLRIQLNLLRAYLFTCREPIIESLQKKVSPRDYLYEHVHQYSITDLMDISSGSLAQQLQKIVEFAKDHVMNCWLCSQKGFICEICNNPKVIYPFHMESTYRCAACNAVFHANCLNASKPCPKCERRRKRTDLPLLDLGHSDVMPEGATTSPIYIK